MQREITIEISQKRDKKERKVYVRTEFGGGEEARDFGCNHNNNKKFSF